MNGAPDFVAGFDVWATRLRPIRNLLGLPHGGCYKGGRFPYLTIH
jgi:hypothetical protein